MNNANYAYAVGRIRALENQLLRMIDFERLLETESAEAVLEELSDTDYGEHLTRIKNTSDFEFILNEELKKVYKLTSELSLDPEITNLFFLKKDLHNLKVLLKSKYVPTLAVEDYLIDLGLFSLSDLRNMVEKNDYSNFGNLTIQGAIKQAIRQFELTHQAELIDYVLDAAIYELSLTTVREYRNTFLEKLFQLEIDTINLKTLVRFIVARKDKRYLKDVLIYGGDIPYEFFLKALTENEKEVRQKIHQERYRNIVVYEENIGAKERRLPFLENYEKILVAGINYWEKNRSFSYLEKLIDDHLTQYLKRAKYISLGIEPLIAYLLAKETEIKNIRTIIVGKLNRLPEETIRERLREPYV